MPRPFLLLVDFGGDAELRTAEAKALAKLLPAEFGMLFKWPTGRAIGYSADAPIADYNLRDALGERGQFLTVELASPGAWQVDGFGEAQRWLSRHAGKPSVRAPGKAR